uniref:Uncharacterized protein n=1 Tax=Romanomermis culicivorax TaxID=13658 RepID=A0A915KFF1_ROMCU
MELIANNLKRSARKFTFPIAKDNYNFLENDPRPCHTSLLGIALYCLAPRDASCPIHTNKRQHGGLPYFASRYIAAPHGAAFLLLDFALLKI